MKHFYFTAISLLVLFCACNKITDYSSLQPSLKSTIHSRVSEISTLPDGSTALFNINGALQITNQVFTYTNQAWEYDDTIDWNEQEGVSYLTAIYPAKEEYTYNTLYAENKLVDILIAQDTLSVGNNFEIEFKHLFSSLTIHLNEVIQKELQEIRLTVPKIVSYLNPTNGEYETTHENQTYTETYNETGSYCFILPSMEEATLDLQLIMQDGTNHTISIGPNTFQSEYNYECNIIKEDERPGIRSAEDLIAFSLLINKQDYTGDKTLSNFGEDIDGQTVYRLLNDISFTEEESQRLLPIGFYDSRAFQHVFDGEGHCISNLILPDKSTYSKIYVIYSGLFGHIGSNGTVKNLHIQGAKSVDNPTCTRIGIIAALNDGKIIDCSITHSTITNGVNEKIGFIAGQMSSNGYIINCSACHDTLTTEKSNYVGGICGYATGNILNCYTANNAYNLTSKYLGGGGIAGYSSANYLLNIHNCYTYYTGDSSTFWAIMESAKKVDILNFFYNEGTLYNTENSTAITQENIFKYDNQHSVNGVSVVNLLNDWINNYGKSTYPELTFRQWTFREGKIGFE